MTETFSEFDWRWKPFDDLSALDVYTMLAARSEVFVVEQHCVYGDVDGQDAGAWHLLVYPRSSDARPALAGYLRVLLPNAEGDAEESDIRIGRVLTTAGFRGIGLGQAMLERTLGFIREQWPGQPIRLHGTSAIAALLRELRLRANFRCSRGRRHPAHLDAPRVKGKGPRC
jgi:ElaA protein